MNELTLDISPGEQYKIDYGPGKPANKTIHILAIVEGMIVFKWWAKSKKSWIYEIQDPYYFICRLESGSMVKKA